MKSLNPWETKTDAPSNVKNRKIEKGVHKITALSTPNTIYDKVFSQHLVVYFYL